jgi:hypothetical protein
MSMPPDDRRTFWRGVFAGIGLVAICTAFWWGVDLARLATTERTTTPTMTDRSLLVRLNEIRTAAVFNRPGVAELVEDLILDVEKSGNVRLARVAGPDPTRPVRLARGTERE